MNVTECSFCLGAVICSLILLLVLGYFSTPMLFVSLGTAAIIYSITKSFIYATFGAIISLFGMALLRHYGVSMHEGFNVRTPPTEISAKLRQVKQEYVSHDDDDGNEGFINTVFKNITGAGYTSPGFGIGAPLVEGFEDETPTKKTTTPAPTIKKEELAAPFKLGEIPNQVKDGPHIDVGSTLMKAIKDLNPDQINAMTKDTKQLIDTQKSLMGMLGTMKPMMQDGKELMDTFQQMFGK